MKRSKERQNSGEETNGDKERGTQRGLKGKGKTKMIESDGKEKESVREKE